MINADSVRAVIAKQLPVKKRWYVRRTPLDYNFSAGRKGLAPIERSQLNFDPEDESWFDKSWFDLLVIGEYDVAEGGGANPFICVNKNTGAVFGLDFEREDAQLFPFNSDIARFVKTFTLLDKSLSKKARLPVGTDSLVRSIDPKTYPRSEWKLLVDHVLKPD